MDKASLWSCGRGSLALHLTPNKHLLNMTQQEKFALHLPYEVKVFFSYRESIATLCCIDLFRNELSIKTSVIWDNIRFDEVKPYLRPWSQLTQECTQKDYNDGKPFVPYENFFIKQNWNLIKNCLRKNTLHELPFFIIQILLSWHFAIGFEQREYIEVTNDNNPY